MNTLWQDLRSGARMLLKKPGFTLIVALTLALGIGANTAIFSVVNAVLLRPLPYDQPESLVALHTAFPTLGYPREGLSEAEFIRLRQENRSFAELAGWYSFGQATLRGVSEPESVAAPFCTANFFRTLGVKVALGRDFNAEEEVEGKNKFVVLSHAFWQRKFAGDRAVIGRTLDLDGSGYTVIGVLPASFKAPMELRADTHVDLWRGSELRPSDPRRGNQYIRVIGRLRPDATLAQAQAEHHATARREARDVERDFIIAQVRTMDDIVAAAATQPRFNMILFGGFALLALGLGAVGIYGVIAYTVAQRTHEIGVRMALGAQSRDVLKLVVAEGMALAASGVGIGLLASFALTRLMKTLLFGVSATDPMTFGSIALLLTGVALLACYIPARRAAKVDPMVALRCE